METQIKNQQLRKKKRSFFEAEQDARKTLLANSTQINEENIKGK